MKYRLPGFSLVEILVWILIVSIVMVAWFQALSAIGIGKIKLIEKKEQAIGYSEYKDSELYKQICTQNQTPPKKENKLLDEQAKQLKDKIHNKILNGKVWNTN